MHRTDILDKLARYTPRDEQDAANRDRIAQFIRDEPACFERSTSTGHITGAGWLLDRSARRVLLTHHRKLSRWLQLGGHADGDSDILAVALREAREESGLANIKVISDQIFDLDIHPIPAIDNDPPHVHYDIRFLLQAAGDDAFRISDESHDLRWFTFDELGALGDSRSIMRMRQKWLDVLAGRSLITLA